VHRPRRLAAVAILTSTGVYLILANPWVPIIGGILLVVVTIILASLLLTAVWSRKKCRRDSAYILVKLIIGSRRT
jgi:hypothetical protein